MTIIRAQQVVKVYDSNGVPFRALQGVSFSVEKGDFLSIAGPSGSGKTTLLNILGCLDTPSGGTVFLDDIDIGKSSDSDRAEVRRHRIGFVFQTFNLVPILSAFENVEFPLTLLGKVGPAERRARVEEMLSDVGLKDFMKRKPSELSGGQQQRVAVARALIKQPDLVLADEPTANLDSRTGGEILDLMLQMNQKTATTFIFSTHDRMVMEFAGRLIRLKDGLIESDDRRGEE